MELDILACAREERKGEGVQSGMARGTAPATAGRFPRRSLRHGRHQHDSIPSTASSTRCRIPWATSWATSSPSVETRVLSTSGAALSYRACDLTMAVSSHGRCLNLQQLTSSAPRRILLTFLTRRSVLTTCVRMHDAHTQHFKVVDIEYAYSTSFPAVFTYMCIFIALRSSKTFCFELRPAHGFLASVLKFWTYNLKICFQSCLLRCIPVDLRVFPI